MGMIPVNITLSDQQKIQINELMEQTGLTMSELIRRAVDDLILKYRREQNELKK